MPLKCNSSQMNQEERWGCRGTWWLQQGDAMLSADKVIIDGI